jgi:hypothetical protein
MANIRRVSSPKAQQKTKGLLRMAIELSDEPSPSWATHFTSKSQPSDSFRSPKDVKIEGKLLVFESAERYIGGTVRMIDTWIANANKWAEQQSEAENRQTTADQAEIDRLNQRLASDHPPPSA